MKKKLIRFGSIFLIALTLANITQNLIAYATSATTYTYTYDNTGYLVRTQDAYLPGVTLTSLGLNRPEDIFIDKNNILYIADNGNKRVVRYDITSGEVLDPIVHNELLGPQGLFVTNDLELYIADKQAKAIFKFDVSQKDAPNNYLARYDRPTDPTFGEKTAFAPIKVGVDANKNMFVLSESVLNGIIYLSNNGSFLEYFTSNRVRYTFLEWVQDIFFTEAQIQQIFPRVPSLFTNFFVGDDGIVYTTSSGENKPIKKHNTSGSDMFNWIWGFNDLVDIWVDNEGMIYTASKRGFITVYTNEGEFTYIFSARNTQNDIAGVFEELVSIAVDNSGNVWGLDTKKGFVQSYSQTDYAKNTYKAVSLFNEGKYQESLMVWEEILRFNQMSVMAHNGIGKCHLYLQQYEQAMNHFEIAGNRYLYSEAFWEVRNTWLQNNLPMILLIVIIFVLLHFILKSLDKRYNTLTIFRKIKHKILSVKLIADLLFSFSFLKKPIDSYYELKTKRKGSLLAAIIIFLLFFTTLLISIIGKDFIYQFQIIEQIDFNSIIIGFFSIVFLFILCNYLVSSIQDGEGSVSDVFKLTMYALTPYLLGLIAVTSLSYVLTYNESFVLQYIEQGTMIWSLILLLIGVQEINVYDTRDAVKSLIYTLVFMLLVAIMLLIVIILWEQLYSFIEVVIKEVFSNVFA